MFAYVLLMIVGLLGISLLEEIIWRVIRWCIDRFLPFHRRRHRPLGLWSHRCASWSLWPDCNASWQYETRSDCILEWGWWDQSTVGSVMQVPTSKVFGAHLLVNTRSLSLFDEERLCWSFDKVMELLWQFDDMLAPKNRTGVKLSWAWVSFCTSSCLKYSYSRKRWKAEV